MTKAARAITITIIPKDDGQGIDLIIENAPEQALFIKMLRQLASVLEDPNEGVEVKLFPKFVSPLQ